MKHVFLIAIFIPRIIFATCESKLQVCMQYSNSLEQEKILLSKEIEVLKIQNQALASESRPSIVLPVLIGLGIGALSALALKK